VRLAAAGTPLLWVSLETVDEARELAALVSASRPHGLRLDVVVRINPQVRPETHVGLSVGATGSKFGVLAEELPDLVAAGGGPDGPLRWRGVHVHAGSQLGAVDAWRSSARVALAVFGLQRGSLPDWDTLDAGAGFPVGLPADAFPEATHFARAATEALDEIPADARPARLAIEPGRAVVARAGSLLARVLHVREREPRQLVLDAGMTELIRPAMYGARHPIQALTSLGRPVDATGGPSSVAVIHGPVCESTDLFGDAELPELGRGDLVAIGLAGAYGSAMTSRYNGRPHPAEIAWDGERLNVLRRRGSAVV
jgi:diaminopimelate decarboxylase